MQYELSSAFARSELSTGGFPEVWKRLCHDFLSAVFPSNSIVRKDRDKFGIDILDETASVAYCCHSVDIPNDNALPIEEAILAFEQAVHNRAELGWRLYNIASNAAYSDEAIGAFKNRMHELGITLEEVGFIGPATWNRLCSEHPRVVENWFDYRISVSKDAVKKAFEEARYYPEYVANYSAQIEEADFHIILTNNRTPLQFVLPFSPRLSVKELLEVGKVLLDLSLEDTDFHDLGTSARLSLSVVINGTKQAFKTQLGGLLPSGGEAQLWIKIIWSEKSFDQPKPGEVVSLRSPLPVNFHYFALSKYTRVTADKVPSTLLLKMTLDTEPSLLPKASPKEETLARRVALVSARIWQKAASMLPSVRTISSRFGRGIPVRLGASAPRIAEPGSNFTARFVAYHPDLEVALTKQLEEWNSEVPPHLDAARANWKVGTRVSVLVYGEDLTVDPNMDGFYWEGGKHVLDFRVGVSKTAIGERDLKFDVYVKDSRLTRIWMPLQIAHGATGQPQTKTINSPRTAFASYASEDRARVLDRVAALEIHCGLQVFLDCVSMRPNAKWRELLPDMVLQSDQLLLFWSEAARNSEWVDKEWRLAFSHKGIDGIEIHPLSTYDVAKLPMELADLAHGADPLMVIRAHEEVLRAGRNP
jgi:hypothetical protein